MSYEMTDAVKQYIIDNHKLSDEELLGGLIPLGCPFNSAKKILKDVLESEGLRMSKQQRDEKAADLLSDFTPTEETEVDEVNEMIENLVEELDVSAKIARAYVRAVFTENEVEMPKATRAAGGPRTPREPGFNGDSKLVASFVVSNPNGSEEDFRKMMEAAGADKTSTVKDKAARWFPFSKDLYIFAEAYMAAHCNK